MENDKPIDVLRGIVELMDNGIRDGGGIGRIEFGKQSGPQFRDALKEAVTQMEENERWNTLVADFIALGVPGRSASFFPNPALTQDQALIAFALEGGRNASLRWSAWLHEFRDFIGDEMMEERTRRRLTALADKWEGK
jgi:hypothetical protein